MKNKVRGWSKTFPGSRKIFDFFTIFEISLQNLSNGVVFILLFLNPEKIRIIEISEISDPKKFS